jgi:hypothetical protein
LLWKTDQRIDRGLSALQTTNRLRRVDGRHLEFEMTFVTFKYPVTKIAMTLALLLVAGALATASAQVPESIAVTGATEVLKVHAEGAQIYECKADSAGKLAWTFREPIATLLVDGKTVGRHYAGPNWEHSDGSAVAGKAVGNAPGATAKDIPWLKLEVASRRGTGILTDAAIVQRINTQGGQLSGACERAGLYQSAPYSADYVFWRKS